MKIYLATWLEKSQGQALTKKKSRKRLLSFYHLPKKEDELLNYVKKGE